MRNLNPNVSKTQYLTARMIVRRLEQELSGLRAGRQQAIDRGKGAGLIAEYDADIAEVGRLIREKTAVLVTMRPSKL